ncbi:MAG: DUF4405 domain-containing protein [Spirochaetales bacterium]|nr:DUF4405 domain-containing protein [Spirochaetales bacterium]
MKVKKNTVNYIVDIIIAITFAASAVSGTILMLYPHGSGPGYGGGRGYYALQNAAVGMNIRTWRDLHTVFSIMLAAGAFAHLLLHLKWMKCMTQNLFRRKPSAVKCESVR